MPGLSGGPVVTTLVCFVFITHEAAGALGARHSPRPRFFQGERFMHHSGASAPRECGVVSQTRHPLRNGFAVILRDASLSLSSGAHSRDPLAMLLRMTE